MDDAVVIDAIRTPVGRASADTGIYRSVRADDLSAGVMQALVQRTGIDPAEIEDVQWGCVQQQGEQGFDVARMALLIAGLPVETGGATVNRNCGSSLQAIHAAAQSIRAGCEDVQIVGGVEHMEHIPMDRAFDPNPAYGRRYSPATLNMGMTAEYLARKYGIGRAEQDAFALRSHQRAAAATESGEFAREVVPTWGRDTDGRLRPIDRDQGIRPDTSLEALAALPPAFLPEGGSVTAGNSSQVSVGAAALLIMSSRRARALGLTPWAKVRAMAVAGVDPAVMGLGPVPATHKALERAGLTIDAIDLVEINEAFAAQTLSVIALLGLDPAKVNVRGGAIALGHPLGASGARIATTLLHLMADRGARLGLATMCIGAGQGIATIFERCDP